MSNTTQSYVIRDMLPTDIKAVARIEALVHEDPWDSTVFFDCLRVGYLNWVIECAGEVQGYLIANYVLDEVHLLNLTITPIHQGHGLGKALLEQLIQVCRTKHMRQLFLEVRRSNQIAYQLYTQRGFTLISTRKNYYRHGNGHEDALVMVKWL
jgi:ribosomal-protein-alanine N-acetyltransferase